jgi:hypothetical protein
MGKRITDGFGFGRSQKKKKLVAVLDAANRLLMIVKDTHRISSYDYQDRTNLWLVFDFMFEYRLNWQTLVGPPNNHCTRAAVALRGKG